MEYNGNPESVGYKVKYSRADGRGKTLSHVVRDRLEREHTIEDLEEWTEYRVQVQAFNAIGSGPWSQVVVGRTRESGTARWSQPPRDSPSGPRLRVPPVAGTRRPPPAPVSLCPRGCPGAQKPELLFSTTWARGPACAPQSALACPPVSRLLTLPTGIPTAPSVPAAPTSKPSALTLTPVGPKTSGGWASSQNTPETQPAARRGLHGVAHRV